MNIFGKPLKEVTFDDIQLLVTNEVEESRYVDYKSNLDLSTERSKEKFLGDISAFANTHGGYIIYGISEIKGKPSSIQGIEITNFDKLKQQIQGIISTGIEPTFKDFEIHHLEAKENKIILIIYIKQSWAGPHRVMHKKSGFYMRQDGQNGEMDFYQIKEAMLIKEKILSQVRNFINERIRLIKENNGPAPIKDRPKLVLHLIPINAFVNWEMLNPSNYINRFDFILPISTSGKTAINFLNIDGLVATNTSTDHIYSYMQLFRNGIIEACDASIIKDEKIKTISYELFDKLNASLFRYFSLLEDSEIYGSFVVEINFINIKGYKIDFAKEKGITSQREADRDNFKMSIMIEGIPNDADKLLREIKPIFDMYFNAFGLSQNYYYDHR